MAVVALQHRMGADQRKAVLVIANLLERNLPSLDRMAALAICSKLAAMNVGVAVRAVTADVLENQIDVALGASHLRMHAAQRIARLVMIELRIGADRLPARIGVALLAGDRERSMRIGHLRLWASHTWPRVVGRLLRCRTDQQRRESSQQRDEPTCALHLTLRIPDAAHRRFTHTQAINIRRAELSRSGSSTTPTRVFGSWAEKI